MSRAALGCKATADATKAMAVQGGKDTAALERFQNPMVASGACIPLAKGVMVSIDEERRPLSCVRLSGDLSCYWVPDGIVDQHPGEKGKAGGPARGSHRH